MNAGTLAAIAVSPFVGSFLAVVAVRLPAGKGFVSGRSACDACGAVLGPGELVPLVSYALQRGRCRHCGAAIDRLHPVMELAALLIAVWAAVATPDLVAIVSCLLGWALLLLAAIDWRTGLLPDVLTLPLLVAGLAVAAAFAPEDLLGHVIGAAAGLILFAGLSLLYRRVRRRDGLGLGDAKLLAAGGAWLSWTALPSVILFASLIALALVLLRRPRGEAFDAASRIAFGPALAGAIWIVWLYGPLVLG